VPRGSTAPHFAPLHAGYETRATNGVQRQRARVLAERAPRRAFLHASQVERLCEAKRTARGRWVSLTLDPSCESTCSDALSRAALAPQLTDRPVCEPPQIPLAVLSQSREAPG
jgi:hypothetical protein